MSADPPAGGGSAAADAGLPDCPLAFGPAPVRARLRSSADDFQVDELLGFEPDGAGAHLLLQVEKVDANTGWVAAQLAGLAAVAPRDTGHCGLKDRRARSTQWYSVPWPLGRPTEPALEWCGEGFRVLQALRHGRKLRLGAHRGNRFMIVARQLEGNLAALPARFETLRTRGAPNYFGPQRFGRDGANLRLARAWAKGSASPSARSARGFALSAARSALFNATLAARVEAVTWDRLLPGEAVVLDGTRSFFHPQGIDAALAARAAALDVHPSGALWGRGRAAASAEAGIAEQRVAAAQPELCALLEAQGLAQERRALRVAVRELDFALEGDTLRLGFVLPRGCFATAVLHELLVGAWDAQESAED